MLSSGGGAEGLDLKSIYESNADMLLRIASRIAGSTEAAEDLVHDAFGKLVEKRMAFPTAADAKYWLIRVVKNGAINYSKRKGREIKAYERWWRNEGRSVEDAEAGSISLSQIGSEAGVQPSAEEEMLRSEEALAVKGQLALLPEKLRLVLILKEYGGMSYKEIGKALGIRESNVKVRAFRAREALLARMNGGCKDVSR
ncbi:MAG TPA: sigma-70 family RNA polymerase sigma factor [Rectinemataceae bacterium]